MERSEKARKLATLAKLELAAGDVDAAAKCWCRIYDLYEEDMSAEGVAELHGVMRLFTDTEVYVITDYIKDIHFRQEAI